MTVALELKPDFSQTASRFEAWWRGEVIDRPPVTLHARPQRPWRGPSPLTNTPRRRRLDAEHQVECAIATIEQHDYPGDAFPAFVPDLGPELAATLLGAELTFTDTTSWTEPIVHAIDQWDAIVDRPLKFDNPCWRAVERMTDLARERAAGRFIVGVANLHNNVDTMAALRDPTALCLDIAEDAERIRGVARKLRGAFLTAFARLWGRIAPAGMGCTTWCPLYHAGPCYLPSCDFWCTLGPGAARDLVLPEVRAEMTPLERTLFHLDGPGALRHLDLLLTLPELDAVQWTYGAGNGPATRWLDVYRRILAAGKSVQVIADPESGLDLLKALGPEGIWLTIDEPFDDLADANAYLAEVEREVTARS